MMRTTICYIEHEGKYLMLHRIKKKQDINAGKWIGVGGKVEPGESADQCVLREVYEETGLVLTKYHLHGIIDFHQDISEDEEMYLYSASEFTGELKADCNEGELKWVPKDEVLDLPTWEGDRLFLEKVLDGVETISMSVFYEGDKLVKCEEHQLEAKFEKSDIIPAKHAFSTRIGGVSEGIYESLNLGFKRGDDEALVYENYMIFGQCVGIPTSMIVSNNQIHSDIVRIVGKKDLYNYLDSDREVHEGDGLVTNERGVPLVVYTADCVPLLMHDPIHGVIAAVHCGWRSTVADIMKNAIDSMCSLGAKPCDIRTALGPAICSDCFETGAEVPEAIDKLLGGKMISEKYYRKSEKVEDKYYVDLRGAIKERLIQLEILEKNVDIISDCTMHMPEKYWSHRYTKGIRGSQASIITL